MTNAGSFTKLWDTTAALGDGNDYCLQINGFSTYGYTSNITVDNTPPTLTGVNLSVNGSTPNMSGVTATVGDTIVVSFTGSEALSNVSATIGGQNATVVNTTGNRWSASLSGNYFIPAGNLAFVLTFSDAVGNSRTATGTTDGTIATYIVPPAVLNVSHIQSNNAHPGYAKSGDIVTFTFTGSGMTGIVLTLGGATFFPTTGYAYATLTTTGQGAYPFMLQYQSFTGRVFTGTTTTDSSSVIVDTIAPVIVEPTPITSSTNTSPSYTFVSTEAGLVTYSGSVYGSITSAVSGSNTLTFPGLAIGATYNAPQLIVTDNAGNSTVLHITPFTVTRPADAVNTNGGALYHGTFSSSSSSSSSTTSSPSSSSSSTTSATPTASTPPVSSVSRFQTIYNKISTIKPSLVAKLLTLFTKFHIHVDTTSTIKAALAWWSN